MLGESNPNSLASTNTAAAHSLIRAPLAIATLSDTWVAVVYSYPLGDPHAAS